MYISTYTDIGISNSCSAKSSLPWRIQAPLPDIMNDIMLELFLCNIGTSQSSKIANVATWTTLFLFSHCDLCNFWKCHATHRFSYSSSSRAHAVLYQFRRVRARQRSHRSNSAQWAVRIVAPDYAYNLNAERVIDDDSEVDLEAMELPDLDELDVGGEEGWPFSRHSGKIRSAPFNGTKDERYPSISRNVQILYVDGRGFLSLHSGLN